ncbi:DUF397 domain-containing protein [Phytohabitans rumicis]|uniref:DUF397 domain-containing protein n=1 Tax=Phytohabitans rumicis TaxID=1076125 RepID=A0A6V8LI94_9ACTN|nr:DUF397 domain-containing protein [Phytohabitans rumicis]GFJ94578.1 hypothetical protein Prum_082200 [Phytohabitans rumicis]
MAEIDPALATPRKSSYSGQDGDCVEIAILDSDRVGVRDSKDPDGPFMTFTHTQFAAFLAAVKNGEFRPR